ncbi:hypothetical protein [Sphingomonas sp. 3-13AW]|uniref:hypothetical protein n=1 Tax=Sphingomonas sp. 3-13AW TaxID=3050450 RepID=UPI003BB521D2
MSSYATNIAIGGHLPANRLHGLLNAAAACGVALDWNGDRLNVDARGLAALREAIIEAATSNEPLRLYNDSAKWGKLPPLETFCQEHDLVFRREHDPDAGEIGIVVWWQPSMPAPSECQADGDGKPFVYVDVLADLLDAANTPQTAVDQLRAFLSQATPIDIGCLRLEGV